MIMSDFRSRCTDDIRYMLGTVHGDNSSKFSLTAPTFGVRIYGGVSKNISKYNVSVSTPFSFQSDGIQRAVSVLHCISGSAEIRLDNDNLIIKPGQLIVIGSNLSYRISCKKSFSYTLTLIFDNIVETYCEKITNRPINGAIYFDTNVASDKFLSLWGCISDGIDLLLTRGEESPVAIGSIVDYAVALLLEAYPHNYSTGVFCRDSAGPEVVREAKRFVEQNAHRAITVADVASFAGCGIRTLHHGFCEHLGLPPRAFIERRQRRAVGSPGAGGALPAERGVDPTSESAAKVFGQIDGPWAARPLRPSGTLSSLKIDLLRHHINVSLGVPMTVCELATMVGMSSRRFAAAFRRAFGTSPAQYVIWERLKWACWLLVNTNDSIAAIASDTGFGSQSYLTTALKGWNGQTPCELRKLSRSLRTNRDNLMFCVN